MVRQSGVPVVAVCPLVGGQAVKGPTAKIMAELGLPLTPAAIASHYAGWIDGLVVDSRDADAAVKTGVPVHLCNTLMTSLDDKQRLAAETLAFAATLRARRRKAA
jgi:LPPG:FO 2-phospho-L-lactate transferase